MLSARFLVVHNTSRCCQDEVTKLTRWQKVAHISFYVFELDVKARTNDSAFVEAASQVDHNLAGSMIVDNFELANVSWMDKNTRRL